MPGTQRSGEYLARLALFVGGKWQTFGWTQVDGLSSIIALLQRDDWQDRWPATYERAQVCDEDYALLAEYARGLYPTAPMRDLRATTPSGLASELDALQGKLAHADAPEADPPIGDPPRDDVPMQATGQGSGQDTPAVREERLTSDDLLHRDANTKTDHVSLVRRMAALGYSDLAYVEAFIRAIGWRASVADYSAEDKERWAAYVDAEEAAAATAAAQNAYRLEDLHLETAKGRH